MNAPVRLTARGQTFLAALLLVGIFGGLLLAYHVGQNRRCEALRADGSVLVARYCPTVEAGQ